MTAWAPGRRTASPQRRGYMRQQDDDSRRRHKAAKRRTPGFRKQFAWCFKRAVLQRCREPSAVFLSYAIIILTGVCGPGMHAHVQMLL